MVNKTDYGTLFYGTNNPFTAAVAFLPSAVSAQSLHDYMLANLPTTPIIDNQNIVTSQIVTTIQANARKYARIADADAAALSPLGAVSITETTTRMGVDTHANAHTGTDSDALTRTGTDTTTNNNTATDSAATYDNGTLQPVAQSENYGGGGITYGSTHTTTRTHGTTDTLTDTYGTTTTKTTDGIRIDPENAMREYLDVIRYSLIRVIINDVVGAISLIVY